MKYKLPYIRAYGDDVTTDYGIKEIIGIDEYRDTVCRDKVVFRIDLLYGFKNIISNDTVSVCRNVLYNVLSGKQKNKEKISELFMLLYLNDDKFKRYLGEVVYFSNYEQQQISLYSYVIKDLLQKYERNVDRTIEEFQRLGNKYLFESSMYLYFSFDDDRHVHSVLDGYNEEVISRAKVWNGTLQKVSTE